VALPPWPPPWLRPWYTGSRVDKCLYAERYFRRGEDGDGGYDEVERENPEAQAVDDHRRELPVVGFLGVVVLVLDLARDEAQLVQYRQQLAAHAVGRLVRTAHAEAGPRVAGGAPDAAGRPDSVAVVEQVTAGVGVG